MKKSHFIDGKWIEGSSQPFIAHNPATEELIWQGKEASDAEVNEAVFAARAEEINFDGLACPTHHFGGYAYGNTASMGHKKEISHPKRAALEGLNKMQRLDAMGIAQAVLPPQFRPAFKVLRKLGFSGSDSHIFRQAAKESPLLFYTLSSSSAMWAANSATISPSADTLDGKVHITIANLASHFHRWIEAQESWHLLRLLFKDENSFVLHPPLPSGGDFGDEGAANHTRFCTEYGEKGVNLFVYGKSAFESSQGRYPFRQAKEASESVARLHGLDPLLTIFARQNPEVIDLGVFHNDVISVGNQNIFFYHEKAFVNTRQVIDELQEKIALTTLCVTEEMMPVTDAVKSYLFNGQLLSVKGEPMLILPKECASVNLNWLPWKKEIVDLTESMHNGGGPACLRLRCVLTREERAKVHSAVFFSPSLYSKLVSWVERHFREQLSPHDLADPALLQETCEALDDLSQILDLGAFYEFQN